MPRLKVQALTAGWVKRTTKPGAYSDGYGLTLRIDARVNKRWVQRLTIGGRQRNLGLGSWPSVSLDEAREMAVLHPSPSRCSLARARMPSSANHQSPLHQ